MEQESRSIEPYFNISRFSLHPNPMSHEYFVWMSWYLVFSCIASSLLHCRFSLSLSIFLHCKLSWSWRRGRWREWWGSRCRLWSRSPEHHRRHHDDHDHRNNHHHHHHHDEDQHHPVEDHRMEDVCRFLGEVDLHNVGAHLSEIF